MLGLGLSLPEVAARSVRSGLAAASLDMDFLSMADGPVRVTRDSPAYALDGYGTLRRYAENTPRYTFSAAGEATPLVEGAAVNMLKEPDRLDQSVWVKNLVTVQADAGTDPLGTSTADKVIPDAATVTFAELRQDTTVVSGTTYTFSCFCKAAGYQYVQVDGSGSIFGTFAVNFDLNTGTETAFTAGTSTVIARGIQPAGNGWYRVFATVTALLSGPARMVVMTIPASNSARGASWTPNGTDGVLQWGAMLETGTLSSYTPGTRAADVLSNPAAARTLTRRNLLARSQEFDNAAWVKGRAAVTAAATLGPDGTTSGARLTEDNTLGNHFIQGSAGSVTAGQAFTFSIYCKAAERSSVLLTMGDAPMSVGVRFNLATATSATVSGSPTSSMAAIGNGWFRLSVSGTTTAAGSLVGRAYLSTGSTESYTGDNTSGAFFHGAQLETGSTATAYIPTAASAVTATDIDYRLSLQRWGSATGLDAYGQIATYAANVPRFDPATGLLIREAEETNLVLNSGSLSNFGTAAASRTLSAATAPDGTVTASRFTATGTANTSPGIGATIAAGTPYTFSIHLRKEGSTYSWFRIRVAANTIKSAFFNIDTGAWGSVETASGDIVQFSSVAPVSLGSGWWRIGVTFTSNLTSVGVAVAPATASGSGTMNIDDSWLMWGAQLERNGLTSYIPTTSAAVTRAADTLTAPIYSLDSRATYTGPSISWQGDLSGQLVTTPHNLIPNSQDFSAGWTQSNGTVAGSMHLAPDGTTTGDSFTENSTSSVHEISRGSVAIAAGSTLTLSVYAKENTGARHLMLALSNTSGSGTAHFSPSAGTVGTVGFTGSYTATSAISPAGSGWHRCSITVKTATDTTLTVSLRLKQTDNGTSTYLGGGTASLYLWGAQLEQHPYARPYRRTTTAAWYGPVFDYDATGTPAGLRIEEARTNLLQQSNSFGTAPWGLGAGGDAVVATGAIAAPDGTTALTLEDANAAGLVARKQSMTITSGSGSYTGSAFLKAGTSSVASIRMELGGGTPLTAEGVINLGTGAVQWRTGNVGTTVVATSAGNGWWRLAVTITDNATGNTSAAIEIRPAFAPTYSATPDVAAVGTVYAFGAQVEAGSFATSYIATQGATATRAADVVTVPNIASWYNQAEGTLFVEAQYGAGINAFPGLVRIDDGSTNNVISLFSNGPATEPRFTVTVGGVNQAAEMGQNYASLPAGSAFKFAAAFRENDFAACRDGLTPETDTSGTMPTGLTTARIGFRTNGTYHNGYIRRVRVYRTRLPDATLQSITQ